MNNKKRYKYDAILHEKENNGGAYVASPWDIRREFGRGRVKVHAQFVEIPYDGDIVHVVTKEKEDGHAGN